MHELINKLLRNRENQTVHIICGGGTGFDEVDVLAEPSGQDKKQNPLYQYDLVGGGGANMALAVRGAALQFGHADTNVTLITEIGQPASIKNRLIVEYIREKLQDGNINVIDEAVCNPSAIVANHVQVHPGGRDITRGLPVKSQFDIQSSGRKNGHRIDLDFELPFHVRERLAQEDERKSQAWDKASYAIAAAKHLNIAMDIVSEAWLRNIECTVDYDAGTPELAARQEDLLRYATNVMIPDEAVLPESYKGDPGSKIEKARFVLEQYPNVQFVAISSGMDEVLCMERKGRGAVIHTLSPPVLGTARDSSASGDTRTSWYGWARAMGASRTEAIALATGGASAQAMYYGRSWINAEDYRLVIPEVRQTGYELLKQPDRGNNENAEEAEAVLVAAAAANAAPSPAA